jgi:hypothetical protein
VDDDCDGEIDEIAMCPDPTDLCLEGQCLRPCADSEFACPFGFACETFPQGDFCVPDPCAGVDCGPGSRCDQETGECDALCDDPGRCLEGEVCTPTLLGFVCEDCFDFGCPEGQLCVAGAADVGTCVEDACFEVSCDPGQFCQDGECLSNVCDPPCEIDQVCDPSTLSCVEACNDLFCMNVVCPQGQRCDTRTGRCGDDPCATVTCNPGQVQELVCLPTEILCTCTAPPPAAVEEVLATGGGGCACRATRSRSSLLSLFLLPVLLLPARRKRW